MDVRSLLIDIKDFIDAARRSDVTEAEVETMRFKNGAEISEAITEALASIGDTGASEFDPYTDKDTVEMLELAGYNTSWYRNRNRLKGRQ